MASWFRLYTDVLDDPKVQKLSPELFRHWINSLCLASRNNGVLPDIGAISFAYRLPIAPTIAILNDLLIAGLIEKCKGGPNGFFYRPHNWDSRQFKSDSSTERVRKFRNVSETLHETHQNRTEQNRAEGEEISPSPVDSKNGSGGTYSEDFLQFWQAYPKRVGKGEAFKAWKRVGHEVQITVVLVAVQAQADTDQWRRNNGQFIPNPATWLNQRRWEDSTEPLRTREPHKHTALCKEYGFCPEAKR